MSSDFDDELVQDFIVEAGEIHEQLSEQLVDLEHHPDDMELLNAIFRGFHTIKGGAGFLNFGNLVDVCHRAEDVFNLLRQGDRSVDPAMMDAFLKVVDLLGTHFEEIQEGDDLTAPDPALLKFLEQLSQPGGMESTSVSVEAPPVIEAKSSVSGLSAEGPDELSDDEFEGLLDSLHGEGPIAGIQESTPAALSSSSAADNASMDQMTEAEFEGLLDQLHGDDPVGENVEEAEATSSEVVDVEADIAVLDEPVAAEEDSAGSSAISNDEFEALLGELQMTSAQQHDLPIAASLSVESTMPPPVAMPAGGGLADKPSGGGAATGAAGAGGGGGGGGGGGAGAGGGGGKKKKSAGSGRGESTVRVDTRRLDEIMNLVGELVLVRNRLSTLKTDMGDDDASRAIANLDHVTTDLQNAVMETRMQPIKKVFGRFPRVVRDLARTLHKEVALELVGEETDLDKNLVEALADPLVHLVRNAVDHGIEAPDVRVAAGKARGGRIVLSAEQEGDHILLTITDDGAGMDADVLRRKAVEKGLMDMESAGQMDDRSAFALIFMPGFSTKQEISDVSGRGVGMDVVKNNIMRLNGSVEVDSYYGKGSTISIRVPLTLAILPTLMVAVGDRSYAIPLASVIEIFNLEDAQLNVLDGQTMVRTRGKALPMFYLRNLFTTLTESDPAQQRVVIVEVGSKKVGFVVDQVNGQEEVVIKPLGTLLHGMAGYAGATITGDGRIALILDIPSLMDLHA